MPLFLLFALAEAALADPMDFPTLDEGIERCQRETVLPIFNSEAARRSAFVTAAYQEQVGITQERILVARARRAIREAARAPTADRAAAPKPPESDQELALGQLALDDRQRALDDRRRLETMRQEAIDLKRQYFLLHCTSPKKGN